MRDYSIENVIYRYANSFDIKDWKGLRSTLAATVECDYRSLRGTCQQYTKEEFVKLRIKALQILKTQHLFSNLEIECVEDKAQCRLSAFIQRQNDQGIRFNTHALYDFGLIKQQSWLIEKIKQVVLWNDGDSTIHAGAK